MKRFDDGEMNTGIIVSDTVKELIFQIKEEYKCQKDFSIKDNQNKIIAYYAEDISLSKLFELIHLAMDIQDFISIEAQQKATISDLQLQMKESILSDINIKIDIETNWKIYEFIQLKQFSLRLAYDFINKRLTTFIVEGQTELFKLHAVLNQNKQFTFFGYLIGESINPITLFNVNKTLELPSFLQKILNFTQCNICFIQKEFFQFNAVGTTNLDIIGKGNDSILKFNSYSISYCKQLSQNKSYLGLYGSFTFLNLRFAISFQLFDKNKKVISIQADGQINIMNSLKALDSEVSLPGEITFLEQSKTQGTIDIDNKTLFIRADTQIGNFEALFYREHNKWGFEIKYQFIGDDLSGFEDFLIDKGYAIYCTLDSPRLSKKKGGPIVELQVNLKNNFLTNLIYECLTFLKSDFPSKFYVQIQKGQNICLKLPDELNFKFSMFDIFFCEVTDLRILKKGFEAKLKMKFKVLDKEFAFGMNIFYKDKAFEIGCDMNLQQEIMLLPGLMLKGFSFSGKISPKFRINFNCNAYLADDRDYSSFSYIHKLGKGIGGFTIEISKGSIISPSKIIHIITGMDLLPKIFDLIEIHPPTPNESIIFEFTSSLSFGCQCKLVLLHLVQVILRLEVELWGIRCQISIEPIKINFLSITAMHDINIGPELFLQIEPFQRQYCLRISGLFRFFGLKFGTYLEISKENGLNFNIAAQVKIASLLEINSAFQCLINKDGLSFDASFSLYLSLKTPSITIGIINLPSIDLVGVILEAKIKLSKEKFQLQCFAGISILGISLKLNFNLEITACDFKEIPNKIKEYILSNFASILRFSNPLELLKNLANALWETIKEVGEAILFLVTSPLEFFKKILSKFQGESSGQYKGSASSREDYYYHKVRDEFVKHATKALKQGKDDVAFQLCSTINLNLKVGMMTMEELEDQARCYQDNQCHTISTAFSRKLKQLNGVQQEEKQRIDNMFQESENKFGTNDDQTNSKLETLGSFDMNMILDFFQNEKIDANSTKVVDNSKQEEKKSPNTDKNRQEEDFDESDDLNDDQQLNEAIQLSLKVNSNQDNEQIASYLSIAKEHNDIKASLEIHQYTQQKQQSEQQVQLEKASDLSLQYSHGNEENKKDMNQNQALEKVIQLLKQEIIEIEEQKIGQIMNKKEKKELNLDDQISYLEQKNEHKTQFDQEFKQIDSQYRINNEGQGSIHNIYQKILEEAEKQRSMQKFSNDDEIQEQNFPKNETKDNFVSLNSEFKEYLQSFVTVSQNVNQPTRKTESSQDSHTLEYLQESINLFKQMEEINSKDLINLENEFAGISNQVSQQNQAFGNQEEENKKDKCTCGKPLTPVRENGITVLKEKCVCGKDGKQIKRLQGNIHGFGN